MIQFLLKFISLLCRTMCKKSSQTLNFWRSFSIHRHEIARIQGWGTTLRFRGVSKWFLFLVFSFSKCYFFLFGYLIVFLEEEITSTSLYPIQWLLKWMSFGVDIHYRKKPNEVGWPAAHQCRQTRCVYFQKLKPANHILLIQLIFSPFIFIVLVLWQSVH